MSENKQTMDSTLISDIMGQPEQLLEPPMMAMDPRMVQAQAQAPMMALQQPQTITHTEKEKKTSSKNPFDLTDDQMRMAGPVHRAARCRRCLLLRVLRWRLVSQFKRN